MQPGRCMLLDDEARFILASNPAGGVRGFVKMSFLPVLCEFFHPVCVTNAVSESAVQASLRISPLPGGVELVGLITFIRASRLYLMKGRTFGEDQSRPRPGNRQDGSPEKKCSPVRSRQQN